MSTFVIAYFAAYMQIAHLHSITRLILYLPYTYPTCMVICHSIECRLIEIEAFMHAQDVPCILTAMLLGNSGSGSV